MGEERREGGGKSGGREEGTKGEGKEGRGRGRREEGRGRGRRREGGGWLEGPQASIYRNGTASSNSSCRMYIWRAA